MYTIYCDDKLMYHPELDDYKLISAELEQATNKAGILKLEIPESNKRFGDYVPHKSEIRVYEDEKLLFVGRPISPSWNMYNEDSLQVVGQLAVLNNSVQPPFSYFGSVEGFLRKILTVHNEQVEASNKFKLGEVTVTNTTIEGNIERASDKAMSTWDALEDKLVKPLGGYINIRENDDGVFVFDYLKEPPYRSDQEITQCINLISIENEIDFEPMATALYPEGARLKDEEGKETDERLTIASVNNGINWVTNDVNVKKYGFINKAVVFDDITEPENLKARAIKELNKLNPVKKMRITAADLSKAGYDVNTFELNDKVKVVVPKLGIEEDVIIDKIKKDLLNPESSIIEVDKEHSFTEDFNNTQKRQDETYEKSNAANRKADENFNLIQNTRNKLGSEIKQTAEKIRTEVRDAKYLDGADVSTMISESLTSFEQDPNSFSFRFEQLTNEVDGKIAESKKYINLENGVIKIGQDGSDMRTEQDNKEYRVMNGSETVASFDSVGTKSRNVAVENEVKYFNRWVTRKGAKSPAGYNLNDVWI